MELSNHNERGEGLASASASAPASSSACGSTEREHMFDKVVTPSDVGKLNRLVIPKQHAEKYFPLDSSTNDKGLLLSFEDRNGKPWRFRYSYWNSSQSYVMTKGWSRFVKDKKLDAGDIVSFQRGVGDFAKHRLFIDWRRRPDADPFTNPHHLPFHHHYRGGSSVPWSPLLMRQPQPGLNYSLHHHQYASSSSNTMNSSAYGFGNVVDSTPPPVYYQVRSVAAAQDLLLQNHHHHHHQTHHCLPLVFNSVPVVHGKAAAKRLRLFGVNMDCPTIADDGHQSDAVMSSPNPNATQLASSSSSHRPCHNQPLFHLTTTR